MISFAPYARPAAAMAFFSFPDRFSTDVPASSAAAPTFLKFSVAFVPKASAFACTSFHAFCMASDASIPASSRLFFTFCGILSKDCVAISPTFCSSSSALSAKLETVLSATWKDLELSFTSAHAFFIASEAVIPASLYVAANFAT